MAAHKRRIQPIDPFNVEWAITKYKRGRKTRTITATIRDEKTNLTEEIKLSISPQGAAWLHDDLEWNAREAFTHYQLGAICAVPVIHTSVLGWFLEKATGRQQNREFFQGLKRDVVKYIKEAGPWVHHFAKRVSSVGRRKREDQELLDFFLSKAKKAGHCKAWFFQKNKPSRPIYSMVVALLIELLCGKDVWDHINWTSPVMRVYLQILRQRKRRNRDDDVSGTDNLLKEILGNTEWERVCKISPPSQTPSLILDLLRS